MNNRALWRGIAKNKKGVNEWVVGNLIIVNDFFIKSGDAIMVSQGITRASLELNRVGAYKVVDPTTLGQCTGERDDDKTLLFEEDLVVYGHKDWCERCCADCDNCSKLSDNDTCNRDCEFYPTVCCPPCNIAGKIAVIRWRGDTHYPAFDFDEHDFDCNGLQHVIVDSDWFIRKIGNIHDNPELLVRGDKDE